MLVALCALLTAQSGGPAQAIGRLLSSNPVSIEGRTTWASPKEDFEDPTPLVFSGNKITMQAGIALLQMEDSSGVAGFCGRTSISLMKSKNTMLYAMNSGTISLDLSSSTTDRVLTPDLAVEWKSIAAGRKQGVVSLDSRGGLCVQNFAGSVKISDLLNGQAVDLPPGSSVQLRSGQASAARISRSLDCGCTKPVPPAAVVTPPTAAQLKPATPSPEPAATPPPETRPPPGFDKAAPPNPEPAATPPPGQAVPPQEKLPSALTTVTDENNRRPQPPADTVRQQARSVDFQVSPRASPAPANPPQPPGNTAAQQARSVDFQVSPRASPAPASSPVGSSDPASAPPAQHNPPPSEVAGTKASTETAPVMSATMAVSAETLPQPAERKTFGQKVKNFFRTIFFMKKKAPPPASGSN